MAVVAAAASEAVAVAGKPLHLSWPPEVGEWGAGERAGARGPGVGGNLESVLLSSLDGPRAREGGQETLTNPPVRICVGLFSEENFGWRAGAAGPLRSPPLCGQS